MVRVPVTDPTEETPRAGPPPGTAWLPIVTAPKDGHDILVANEDGGRRLVARWDDRTGAWLAVDQRPITPTHWQELPDPPVRG